MAGDIEMELMEVVEVEEVVILTTTIPWPCQSLLARANNILQFWEKIILDFVINHHLLNGFLQPPQNMVNGRKSSIIDKVVTSLLLKLND